MKNDNLGYLAILVWLSCVVYWFGVAGSVYLMRVSPVFIFIADVIMFAVIWFSNSNLKRKFVFLLISVVLFQIAIALKAEAHPVANPWIALISFVIFLISLFFGREERSRCD